MHYEGRHMGRGEGKMEGRTHTEINGRTVLIEDHTLK